MVNAFLRTAVFMVAMVVACLTSARTVSAQLRSWDGAHRIDNIEVTLVYFVPKDATPLPDWQQRLQYYAQRIEQFHHRELQGQSTLSTKLPEAPFRSTQTVEQLRKGDANSIFFKTLGEVDKKLKFGQGKRAAFPILLVLSEINWKPLDDFYRVKPTEDENENENENEKWIFEGNLNAGRHFPGAESGGARAVYLTDRGIGWGLVSGDGWRVPYSGSDCVVYHEGVGHSIGLPHNEPADGAVMSLGQYKGWIHQSWLDETQKKKLGWVASESRPDQPQDLFSSFTALAEPVVPKPDEKVTLKFTWPQAAAVKSLRARVQTDLRGPWLDVPLSHTETPPTEIALGSFDRATPVSYRVDAELADAQRVELWGYFQVRQSPDVAPLPYRTPTTWQRKPGQTTSAQPTAPTPLTFKPATDSDVVDLLNQVEPAKHAVSGQWSLDDHRLTSPKAYGARLELPHRLPEQYELIVIAEPLDEPNGLILGQKMSSERFLVLINYQSAPGKFVSALENVDGVNFTESPTRLDGPVLTKNRLSQIVVRVEKNSVTVDCDGHSLIRWQGESDQLSLSDYWTTPSRDSLFLGAYDCRYRFHRVTLRRL